MIIYKKLQNDLISELELLGCITPISEVKDVNHALYRCSKFKILDIYHMITLEKFQEGVDHHNQIFKVNNIIEYENYDINDLCTGTHCHLTKIGAYWHLRSKNINGIHKLFYPNGNLLWLVNETSGSELMLICNEEGEIACFNHNKDFVENLFQKKQS